MKKIKEIFRKLENIYAASAFAEEGLHETAIEIINEVTKTEKREVTGVSADLLPGVRVN